MHHRIPKLLGKHIHHDEVMMAEVKTNFAKKETVLFKPFPTCRRLLTHLQQTIFVITVLMFDAVSATIICLVNFSIRS